MSTTSEYPPIVITLPAIPPRTVKVDSHSYVWKHPVRSTGNPRPLSLEGGLSRVPRLDEETEALIQEHVIALVEILTFALQLGNDARASLTIAARTGTCP